MSKFEKLTLKMLAAFYHCCEATAKARKKELLNYFDCSPNRLQVRHLLEYERCSMQEAFESMRGNYPDVSACINK